MSFARFGIITKPSMAAMRVIVVTQAKPFEPFVDDVAHYSRLLSRYARLELVSTSNKKGPGKRVPSDAFRVVLSSDGQVFSSIELAKWLEQMRMAGRDLAFFVGGPKGFGDGFEPSADLAISFGPMTLPHQLAHVVLLEQLYRAHKILANEPYHY